MYLHGYDDFLKGQCAHCSQTLQSNDDKMFKIPKIPNCGSDYIETTSFSMSDREITNFEAISIICGISQKTLAEKLVQQFKYSSGEYIDDVLSTEDFLNEKLSSSVAMSQNLTLCNHCGIIFAEIFQMIRNFRNLSDKNSLLFKALHEQFCCIDEALNIQMEEREVKVENESIDSDDEPTEDPLMVDQNSVETVCMESNLENMKEEYSCNNESGTIAAASRSSEKSRMRQQKRKQDLKTVAIVLDKLPEKYPSPTSNSRNASTVPSAQYSGRDEQKPDNYDLDRGNRRYSLRKKPTPINKIEILSDDDSLYSPDDDKSLDEFLVSESDFSESENNLGKKSKLKNSSDDTEASHTKRRDSTSTEHYITVPVKGKTNKGRQRYNYACKECGNHFSSIITMRSHLLSHATDLDMEIHPEIVEGPPYQCPKCTKKFKLNVSLKLHCARYHNLKLPSKSNKKLSKEKLSHKCSECSLTFDGIRALGVHYTKIHGITLYFCVKCEKGFRMPTEWIAHNRDVHKLKTGRKSEISENETIDEEGDVELGETQEQGSGTNTEKMTCKECGRIYSGMTLLRKHMIARHPKKIRVHHASIKGPPYQCPECHITYKLKCDLRDHCVAEHNLELIRLRRYPRPPHSLKCDECQLTFKKFESFDVHHRRIHNTQHFPCMSCDKMFLDKIEFLNHEKNDHGQLNSEPVELREDREEDNEEREICAEPFFCRECGFSFKKAGTLLAHSRILHSSRTFDCKDCEETFKHEMLLLIHLANIHKVYARPEAYKEMYWCTDCQSEEPFDSFKSLEKHFQECNHSSFKITCAYCEKQFKDKTDLIIHKKLDHSEKLRAISAELQCTYKCPFCEETFRSMKDRNRHRSTHPQNERLYKCPECPKTYTSVNSLSSHKEMIHCKNLLQCEECGKSIAGLRRFRAHCKTHAEKASGIRPLCDLCGKSFTTKRQLVRHNYRDHLRREEKKCEICGYLSKTMFYWKIHMKVHEKNGIIRKRKKKDI